MAPMHLTLKHATLLFHNDWLKLWTFQLALRTVLTSVPLSLISSWPQTLIYVILLMNLLLVSLITLLFQLIWHWTVLQLRSLQSIALYSAMTAVIGTIFVIFFVTLRTDIFSKSAEDCAREVSSWISVGIDTYIPSRKYQVKPKSSKKIIPTRIICANCGKDNNPEAKYCSQCGFALPKT